MRIGKQEPRPLPTQPPRNLSRQSTGKLLQNQQVCFLHTVRNNMTHDDITYILQLQTDHFFLNKLEKIKKISNARIAE